METTQKKAGNHPLLHPAIRFAALATLAILGSLPSAAHAGLPGHPSPEKNKKTSTASSKKRGYSSHDAEWKEILATRLSHAKELLGRAYRKSIAGIEEDEREYHEFLLNRIQSALPDHYKRQAKKIHHTLLVESKKHGFDPAFLVAVIENESSFNPLIRGTSGEIGLMQVLPSTAKWTAKKIKLPWKGAKSLEDPITNIRIGAAFLAHLRGEFDYHGRLYLSAYNMGTRNVRKALERRVMPKDYAGRVMQKYLQFYEDLRTELTAPSRVIAGKKDAA